MSADQPWPAFDGPERLAATPPDTAATTGLWAVIVWETREYLFAAHGPYSSSQHAGEWAKKAESVINVERGGHVDVVPLWRPEDVGKP